MLQISLRIYYLRVYCCGENHGMEKIADRKRRRPLFTGSCSLRDLKKQDKKKKKKKKKKKMGLLYFSVLLGSQNSFG